MNQDHPMPRDSLFDALEWFLDNIPAKDADLDIPALPKSWLNVPSGSNVSIQTVMLGLARKNAQLDQAVRECARKILLDADCSLDMPARIFIAEMLDRAPIKKRNHQSKLVRDVFIILAIMILKEIGYKPTKGVGSKTTKYSGSEVVLEYLKERRGLQFTDQVETIHKIWITRSKRFAELNLDRPFE